MSRPSGKLKKERADRALKVTLASVVGQVGCLTALIIAIALVAGLWLDSQFHTKPLITLVLVLASMPLALYLMFRVVLSMAPRVQSSLAEGVKTARKEEPEGEQGPGDEP